jgi:hypothetical protein
VKIRSIPNKQQCLPRCLEPGKIEAPKCVDLVSKFAINSDDLQLQH